MSYRILHLKGLRVLLESLLCHRLEYRFSTGSICTVWQWLETFWVITTWGGGATGIQWAEAKDTAKYPIIHRTDCSFHKNYPGQNVNSGLGQEKLQKASNTATKPSGRLGPHTPGSPGTATLPPLSTSGDSRTSSLSAPTEHFQRPETLPSAKAGAGCPLVPPATEGTRPRRKNQKTHRAPTCGSQQVTLELNLRLLTPQRRRSGSGRRSEPSLRAPLGGVQGAEPTGEGGPRMNSSDTNGNDHG